jgi:cytochrome c oxidase subunit 4
MSATAHAAADPEHGLEESKFQIYVQIAMLLAVITGIEIITVYLPFDRWILFTVLVAFSAVKFLFVIFFFMHLRWDLPFCTVLFFIGLVLAGGTMWALLQLFGAEASKPLSSAYLETPRWVATG